MRINVDQVKAGVVLSRIVSPHVALRKVGQQFTGRCPFHEEKTASFRVCDDRQRWRCFGCEENGDVFDFVGKIEGIHKFPDRVRRVAELSGVTLTEQVMTHERLREHAALARAANQFAFDCADYSGGAPLLAERRRADLIETWNWADSHGAKAVSAECRHALAAIPADVLNPSHARGEVLADFYSTARAARPLATKRITELGRGDREHAEAVCWAIVNMIGVAQERHRSAA